MPKFGGHIIIGEGVAKKLADPLMGDLSGDIGAALRLGAVGPDLSLFLFDPAEDNNFVYGALQTGAKVYKSIRDIRDKIDEINDYIGKPVTDLADWMTGGFSTSMLEFTGLAVESFVSCLKVIAFSKQKITVTNPFVGIPNEVLQKLFNGNLPSWAGLPQIDLSTELDSNKVTSPAYIFRYFGAPYTVDPPFKKGTVVGDYSEWWWMDILHYRRTTEFARCMFDKAIASNDPVLKAYAIGYFSHVGGDIVGHPYINSMVGGPFRTHALRHMVIESLLDVRIWSDQGRGEIMNSRLDLKLKLGDEAIRKIAKLINAAMMDVFVTPKTGIYPIYTKHFNKTAPSAADLISAYNVMTGYLASSTDVGLEPPKRPPDSLGALWDEIREHIERSIDKINDYFKDLSHSTGWDWLAALIGLVMWTAGLVVKLLTLPAALVAKLAAIAPRWFFYLVNTALYDFVTNVRFAMAVCGWGYASEKDLSRGLSKRLLDIRSRQELDLHYPCAMTARVDGFWLYHPVEIGRQSEPPRTVSGPYSRANTNNDFIDKNTYDGAHDLFLKLLANPPDGENEEWTTKVLDHIQNLSRGKSSFFGNAVDFSIMLINGKFPDGPFDLDGDRGYGTLQWEGYPPNSRYIP
jgi:Zinc dependent phospholipase C